MTSPRGVPLSLAVLRPGEGRDADVTFEATLVLRALPVELPRLPSPPVVGERAPVVPDALKPVGVSGLPETTGQAYLLFFWATWCGPCKAAVPEVLAFAQSKALPVLAITDEDEETVKAFLAARHEAFFPSVAVDPLRKSFIAYGVSGTPTLLLVDGEGVIRHRQVGYSPDKGVAVTGWRWTGR